MSQSIFDLPLLVVGPAIIVLLFLFAVVGLIVIRRFVLTRLRVHSEDSEFSGAMLQSLMVFYGLAVALIARQRLADLLGYVQGCFRRGYRSGGAVPRCQQLPRLCLLTSAFFFRVEDPRLQGIQVLLLAVFIGLVILMIVALDRPFRGDLGIRSDSYQLIYDQLMKQ